MTPSAAIAAVRERAREPGHETTREDVLVREIDKLREALGWFLADTRYQVWVGGNPRVVNRMLAEARARLFGEGESA